MYTDGAAASGGCALRCGAYIAGRTDAIRYTYTPARVLIYVGQLKNKTRGQRTEEDVKSFFRI